MPDDAVITLTLEQDLRDRLEAEARALHRPAADLLRDLARDFVEKQQADRDYDAYFRAGVEEALRELADPDVALIPHEEIEAEWEAERAELRRLIAEEGG